MKTGFKAYKGGRAESVLTEFFAGLRAGKSGDALRAKLDSRMLYLRDTPPAQWTRPFVAPLADGIIEIRFEVKNVAHRVLGCWGPGDRAFTLLLFATKKDSIWSPRHAIDLAIQRRAEVMRAPELAEEVDEWDD